MFLLLASKPFMLCSFSGDSGLQGEKGRISVSFFLVSFYSLISGVEDHMGNMAVFKGHGYSPQSFGQHPSKSKCRASNLSTPTNFIMSIVSDKGP